MILLEIDLEDVSIPKLERDAPRPIDMDRIASRSKATKRVEVVAGNVHAFRGSRGVQSLKSAEDPRVESGVDPR
jgi:hypothetical protein